MLNGADQLGRQIGPGVVTIVVGVLLGNQLTPGRKVNLLIFQSGERPAGWSTTGSH